MSDVPERTVLVHADENPFVPKGNLPSAEEFDPLSSGKLQGVWLRSLVVSILWLWALRALSFFDQLIFTFSVFEIEVDVFDHLQLLLGLSSEVTIFNLRHTLLGLSSEILNIITFTV